MPFDFDYRKVLELSKAHIRGNTAKGLIGDKDVQVYYDVPLGAGEQAIAWLQDNRQTIRNAVIDFQKLDDVWRSVEIKSQQSTSNKEGVVIAQTFRQGFLESLTKGDEIDFTEARLVGGNGWHEGSVNGDFPEGDTEADSANPQKYFLVEWHGVNPEKTEEIRSALRDTAASGITPVINGESYGSGFYVLDVIDEIPSSWTDSDKSSTITVLLGKPRFNLQGWTAYDTLVASKIYWLFDVPVYVAQSLINIYNKTKGATTSVSAPDERGLVNITVRNKPDSEDETDFIASKSCAYFVKETFYYGIAAPVDAPDNTMGITYEANFRLDPNTGLYSGTITQKVRQTLHVPSYRSDNTHANYTEVERWEGAYLIGGDYKKAVLSVNGSGEIVSDTDTSITLPTNSISAGNTWRVDKRVNDDCTYDLAVSDKTEKEIDDQQYDVSDSNIASSSAVDKLNQESASVSLTAGANEVLRASVRYNKETALYDIVEETTVSKSTEGQDIEISAAATKTVARSIQTDTKPSDPTQEAGKVKATQWVETEFEGRYRASESVVEVNDQTASSGSARADHTSTVTTNTQKAAQEIVEAEEGKVVNIQNRPTEAGMFAVSKEVITPINQATSSEEVRADWTSETNTETQADEKAEATPIDGKIVQTQNRPTEFGKYGTSKTVITPQLQTVTHDSSVRADQTASKVISTNAEEKVDATAIEGKVVTASSRENEFGKFDNQTETVTPINQPNVDGNVSAASISVITKASQADAEVEATAEDGKVVRVSNQSTEFGKVRTNKEVITPINQSAAGGQARADRTSVVTKQTQADEEVEATAEEGKIVVVDNDETEFGKHRTRKEVITPVDQTGESGQARADRTSSTTTHTQSDTVASDDPIDGFIINAQSQPTEFGKYKTSREVITPANQSSDSSEIRADRTSATELNTQANSEADDTPVAGKIIQTQNRPTEFGKYGTQRTVITPLPQTTTHISSSRSDQKSDRTIAINAAAKQDATAQDGKVVNAQSKENEFGKFDNTLEVVTPYDQTGEQKELRSDHTSETVTHTQTDDSPDDDPIDGFVIQTSEAPTEFGKKRTQRTVITPINQTNDSTTESSSESVSEEVNTQADDVLPDAVEVEGEINEVQNVETEFGKFRTTDRTRTTKDQTGEATESRADRTSETETHTQADVEADDSPIEGKIVQANSRPTEFGKFATQKTIITPEDQVGIFEEESASEGIDETVHTQADEVLTSPVETVGKVIDRRSNPTEFGKYHTTDRIRTGKEQTASHISESRADQSTDREWERNVAAKADATPIEGKIVRASSQENEFGLFNNTKETITPEDQDGSTRHEDHSETSTETLHTQADDALADPSETLGEIIDRTSIPTEFGKYKTTDRSRTAKTQTVEHVSKADASQTIARTWEHNAESKAEATSVEGKVVSTRSQENEFGRFDNEKVEVTPINQPASGNSENHLSSTNVTTHTQNDAPEDATAGTGESVEAQNIPTDFGKYRTIKSVSTGNEITVTDYDQNGLAALVTDRTFNGDKISSVPVRGEGEIVRQTQVPTNFKDKYNIIESTEIGQPWTTGWIEYDSRKGAESVIRWGNQAESYGTAIAASLTNDTSNSFGHQKNRFGLWDGVSSKVAAGSGSTFWRSTMDVETEEPKQERQKTTKDEDLVEIYKDEERTVTRIYKSVITQTFAEAEQTKRIYVGVASEDMVAIGSPTIARITDSGRIGWYVEAYFREYGPWTEVTP